MRITCNDVNVMALSKVLNGDLFAIESELYFKTNESFSGGFICFSVRTGKRKIIHKDFLVRPVKKIDVYF